MHWTHYAYITQDSKWKETRRRKIIIRSNRNYQDVFFLYIHEWVEWRCKKSPSAMLARTTRLVAFVYCQRCWALLFYTAELNFVFLSRYTNYCCFLCPAILLPSVNLQWNFWPSRTSLETFFRVPSEYMNSPVSKFTVLTRTEIRLNNPAQIRRIYTIYI